MRELLDAFREKLQRDWQPTAWLLAKLHNVNCTEAHARKEPSDFDVYAKKKTGHRVPFKQQIAAWRKRFVDE
jgi:hypothetical protein